MDPTMGTATLLIIALLSVLALLALILYARMHAFVALVLMSLVVAIVTGVPFADVVPTLLDGFGKTLASVGLLVGFGAMIGRLLEVSGGAQVLADRLVGLFGEKRAPLALGVASLLFGIPIFFDAGLVVMLPVIFVVARRFGGSLLLYAMPAAGAFAIMHAFVPPHPGPVAAGTLLGADIGLLVIVGLILAIPTWYISAYLFGTAIGRRVNVEIPKLDAPAASGVPAPTLGTVLFILLLPLVLIFLNTGLSTLQSSGAIEGGGPVFDFLLMIGQTPVALLITVLAAIFIFAKGRSLGEIEELCNASLGPVCAIILVTGAGGMFGGVLRASGIGDALAGSLSDLGLPIIVAAFVLALGLRVAQGSATVALTTTAGLIAPTVSAATDLSQLDLCFIVIAIAAGSTALSHVNDSGFWLVGRFLGMDEKTTLKTWTVMETIIGVVGFALAFAGSLIF
ncbi:GntP family permease [Oceanicella sp. SM1341]|uniref:GntP family permease n=1 Tax=Oceanicella sp. SM1341 TaxID=1548889 RepID=UPI000E4A2405|nr:GntP family permease [Oceanicella sp. SM1341]